jgi:hypothetical protein
MLKVPYMRVVACAVLLVSSLCSAVAFAQRKPERVEPPKFISGQLNSVFFTDAASQLKGPRPTSQAAATVAAVGNSPAGPSAVATPVAGAVAEGDLLAWHNLISPTALEDLIKGSKLRLDKTITTPAAFAGGGFAIARKEFSMQALLFAIIETYPTDVRWKSSAPVARELLSRVAANTKVGSAQVHDEAKKRLQDLGDLTNGTQLSGKVNSEIDWSKLIDHAPSMQLLEWAQQESISPFTASPEVFAKNRDSLQHHAELVAVLGKVLTVEEMPFADDKEYVTLAKGMIEQAQQLVLAVKTDNAELARQAASKIGQSCTNCHDSFR